MARVDEIVQSVLANLKDLGTRDITSDRVLRELREVQIDVCRRGFAIEAKAQVTLEANKAEYVIQPELFRIKTLIEPATWRKDVTVIHDLEEWKEKIRQAELSGLGLGEGQPLYAVVWQGVFEVYPAPSLTGEVVRMFVYALPRKTLVLSSELSDQSTQTADPEVELGWDKCLEYGTTARLLPAARRSEAIWGVDWDSLYERELARLRVSKVKRTLSGPLKVRSSSEKLGF